MPFIRKIAREKNYDYPNRSSRRVVDESLLVGITKGRQKNTAEVGDTAIGDGREERRQEDKPNAQIFERF